MTKLEKLDKLIKTGKSENIELAFKLCDGQNVDPMNIPTVIDCIKIIEWTEPHHTESYYKTDLVFFKEKLIGLLNKHQFYMSGANIKHVPKEVFNIPKNIELLKQFQGLDFELQ